MRLVSLCLLSCVLSCVVSLCPHEEPGLGPWSDARSWKQSEVPSKNAGVEIDTAVLLDTSQILDVHHIFVAKTGRLVLLPTVDIQIRTRFILVHGALILGSESCPYEGNVTITLVGNRNDDPSARSGDFGEKFLGVENGGVLEMHGEARRSWSKLTSVGVKVTERSNVIDKQLFEIPSNRREFVLLVHVSREGSLLAQKSLLLPKRRKGEGQRKIGQYMKSKGRKLLKWVRAIPADDLILVATVASYSNGRQVERLYWTLGLTPPRAVVRRSKMASRSLLVTAQQGKGRKARMSHSYNSYSKRNVAVRDTFPTSNYSKLYYNFTLATTSGVALSVDKEHSVVKSESTIELEDRNLNWRAGDRILVTSSDYDWRQAEMAEITGLSRIVPNGYVLKESLKNHHSTKYKNRIDTRAEVLLLSRRILIQGEMAADCPSANQNCGNCSRDQQPIGDECDGYGYDTFGGHIMIRESFSRAFIQGVELYNMGQQTQLGAYPIHFHMSGDVGGRAGVRHNSIHRSHARCVTMHGTHNLRVYDNVCYDHLGHGYYLEDGGEVNNTLVSNVGLGTRPSLMSYSDDEPATFWLTSPLVNVENNVAAGGDAVGFWFIFPNQPMGESGNITDPVFKWGEAKLTPITSFLNNVAHSNAKTGLFVGNSFSNDTDTTACTSQYSPRKDPSNPKSPPKRTFLTRFTGYKNSRHNAWVVGGAVTMDQASLADSPVQVFFNERGEGVPGLVRSVLVGKLNDDEPTQHTQRPRRWMESLRGVTFNGRVHVNRVWFDAFPGGRSGAVSFLTNVLRTGSEFGNITWGPSYSKQRRSDNRLYFKPSNRGRTALVTDVDGTLTGWQDSVATNLRWQGDRKLGCRNKVRWNMAVCDGKADMAILFWKFRNGFSSAQQQISTRSLQTPSEIISHIGGGKEGSYVLVQNGSYALDYWKTTIRPELRETMKAFLLEVSNLKAGDHVNFALCLSQQNVTTKLSPNFRQVKSRLRLKSMETDAAYTDQRLGIMFIRFFASRQSAKSKKLTVELYFPPEGNNFHADCRAYTTSILPQIPDITPKLRRSRRHVQLKSSGQPPSMKFLVVAILLLPGCVLGKKDYVVPDKPSGWDRIFAVKGKTTNLEEALKLCQPAIAGPGALATLAHLGSVALGLGEGQHPCGLLRDGSYGKVKIKHVPGSKETLYDAKKCEKQEEDTIYCVDLTLTSVLEKSV